MIKVLLTTVLSVFLQFTDSDYTFGESGWLSELGSWIT